MIKRRKVSDSSTDSLSEKTVSEEGKSKETHKNSTEISMSSVTVKEVCNGNKIKTAPKKVSLKRNHLLSQVSTYIKIYLRKSPYCSIYKLYLLNVKFLFNKVFY